MLLDKLKIMITGAPSTGKSTTISKLKSLLGNKIAVVPESAVVLLAGGFPIPDNNDIQQIKAFQMAILSVQVNLEIVFSRQYLDIHTMIFDRGALDGAGFWPLGIDDYMNQFNINVQQELNHYQFVLFFELPNKEAFGGINSLRFHNYEQSKVAENQLKKVWLPHPQFILIKATDNFADKIESAIVVIKQILAS